MNLKQYLLNAHTFLVHNQAFVLWAATLLTLFNLVTVAYHKSFDPYGLISWVTLFLFYGLFAYAFLLAVLVYKKIKNEAFDRKSIVKFFLKNTGRVLKASFLMIFLFGLLVGIVYVIFDSGLHINLIQGAFADTKDNHAFGFYPLSAIFWTVFTFISAPFYLFPILYFIEQYGIWFSLKKSISLFFKHDAFFVPLVLLYGFYTFISTLFLPTGNYYALFLKGLIDAYLTVLITTAVVLLYKNHYKVGAHLKSTVKTTVKEGGRFARWSIAILTIVILEVGVFMGYGVIISLPEDSYHVQQYVDGLTVLYIIIATAIPFIGLLLKLHKRSLNFLVSSLIGVTVFLTGTVIAAAFFVPPTTTNTPVVEQQFSGDELWEAINDKREEYGVPRLVKNSWACEVAKMELEGNIALGNGNFTPEDSFAAAIKTTQDNYDLAKSSNSDPMLYFLREFITYGYNLENTIYTWEEGPNKLVFIDKQYTHGCAVAKDGYAVVVTAEEFKNEPYPDINI